MIERPLIENAKLIRIRFLSLNEELDSYEDDVRRLAEYFQKISDELKAIESDIKKSDNIKSIEDKVLRKMDTLEFESNKISTKINNINLQIEKLKKEELDLYLLIKRRYPNMSDDEIKKEIQSNLEK